MCNCSNDSEFLVKVYNIRRAFTVCINVNHIYRVSIHISLILHNNYICVCQITSSISTTVLTLTLTLFPNTPRKPPHPSPPLTHHYNPPPITIPNPPRKSHPRHISSPNPPLDPTPTHYNRYNAALQLLFSDPANRDFFISSGRQLLTNLLLVADKETSGFKVAFDAMIEWLSVQDNWHVADEELTSRGVGRLLMHVGGGVNN